MTSKKLLVLLPLVAIIAVAGFSVVHAQTQPSGPQGGFGGHGGGMGMMMGHFPGVVGIVTAISGTTINVGNSQVTSTVYSVDASNATVIKNNATSTVSAIAVGDMVMVRGTVTGTSITATSIFDGKFMGRGAYRKWPFNRSSSASGTPPFGFGHRFSASGTPPFASGTMPFAGMSISGAVSAVNGSTLTVTGTNGTTYSVDITNATLVKQGDATSSISAINVGDNVQIQGTINGTSVAASVVLDNVTQNSAHPGFLGAIKNFFSNLFHFKF